MTNKTDADRSPAWTQHPRLGLLALIVAVIALGLAAAPWFGAADGRTRAYLLAHPELLDQMVQARQTRDDNQRVEAINAAVAANPALLAADPRDPAFGPADAKVTVIEFFDFRCPGCKAVAADYLRLMRAHPEVRFVFKDWPILDRPNSGPISQLAARAALAAHQQGKYLAVYEALMREPALDEDAIQRIMRANGVDMPRAEAAINTAEMTRHLTDTHTTASALGLVGTPTFFINGKTTVTINPAEVERMIAAAKTAPAEAPHRTPAA